MGFDFSRGTPVYDGGKFNLLTGALIAASSVEKYINCAVFSIAFLKSFDDFNLINWNSFPVPLPHHVPYLDDWLNNNRIPEDEKGKYYNQVKELRGKHVLVSPLTATKPSPYHEIEPLSRQLIDFLSNN